LEIASATIEVLTAENERLRSTAIVQSNVAPCLAVEAFLYQSYRREKARADRILAELTALKSDVKTKRAWARTKRLTQLTPKENA